jgi:signal transduction histidine kinase
MKRFLPDSLAAWALIILIAGLIVIQIATLVVTAQSRAGASRMMGFFHLAERVSSLSRAIAAEDRDQRASFAIALSDPTLILRVETKPLARAQVAADDELAELEDILSSRLSDVGVADVHVERRDRDTIGPPIAIAKPDVDAGPIERVASEIAERYAENDAYVASVQLADGSWLNFVIAIAPATTGWSARTIALAAFVAALVLGASIWSLGRLTAPYRLLAAAAERFGRDLNAPPMSERGPREVRLAAHAFNLMRERLQRLIGDRNQMVAAISHDLRTPATRLRLRAEMIDDAEQRALILADLDEMEVMTRSVLAFASDTGQPEQRVTLDLISLLETVCDEMPGATFSLSADLPPRLAYVAEPVALRRCIANLVDNAIKYGNRAYVSLAVDPSAIRIRVDDEGPGIPEAEFETVFRPFRRLETSRNRETGGTGLGLTIARTVARALGGEVTLCNQPEGGLRAEIVLPLPAVNPAG